MNNQSFEEKSRQATCRCCDRRGLQPVLDLGLMPLTAAFVTQEKLNQPEKRYPLEVAFCPGCSLVQVLETVPPQEIFHKDYPYYSSFIDTLLVHSRQNALALIEKRKLGPGSLVIELASNDGYLLKNFVEKGVPVLGIDPAPGPAAAANKAGVRTLCAFFGKKVAEQVRSEGNAADVVIANNVLAHVADLSGFVEGIRVVLKDDGVAVIECPYVRALIDHCEFDTIYHEHLCYYSATALDHLFRRHGLFLNDVEMIAIHGGSLRLYVGVKEQVSDSVKRLLAEEREKGISQYEYYQHFARRVEGIRDDMRQRLSHIRSEGKRIAAYGAAAKGVILLNYVGVGADVIEYCVDRNTHKQGKYLPGLKIPIGAPERLLADQPDYVVLLPWNFKDEILKQQAAYRQAGGKFIVPIPSPQVV